MDARKRFETAGKAVFGLMLCLVLTGFTFNDGRDHGFQVEGVWDGADTSADIGSCKDVMDWLYVDGPSFDDRPGMENGALAFWSGLCTSGTLKTSSGFETFA